MTPLEINKAILDQFLHIFCIYSNMCLYFLSPVIHKNVINI